MNRFRKYRHFRCQHGRAAKTCKLKSPKMTSTNLAETKANWNRQLGKIEIKVIMRTIVNFYTALYHSMIAPTIYSDVDGAYTVPDKKYTKPDGGWNYNFSLWDTYPCRPPALYHTEPERVNDMVKLHRLLRTEWPPGPVWNFYGSETDMMIGYHAVPVIVDAYLKGIGDFDAKKALGCLHSNGQSG